MELVGLNPDEWATVLAAMKILEGQISEKEPSRFDILRVRTIIEAQLGIKEK